MLPSEAERALEAWLQDLERGARACIGVDAPVAVLLFILSSTEFLSLYYAGSRRTADTRGTRAFSQFLARYFTRFNRDARDPKGHLHRVRIPVSREGGKASRRLRLPAALIHLYRRGVIQALIAPPGPDRRCVITPAGRWGFQIRVEVLHEDFQEALKGYWRDVHSDTLLAERFLTRFYHLHGKPSH
jgi:hypothetical protein